MDELRMLLRPLPEPGDPFTGFLVIAVLIARSLDVLATWVVTPRLELEANPIARRIGLGWMAVLNALLLALPFLHHGLSIALVVTSLLVAGTTLAHGALARGMGERRQVESQVEALRRLGVTGAVLLNSLGSLIVCGAGAFMAFLLPETDNRGWWAAMGVVLFGITGLVHVNLAILRLYRLGRRIR